MFYCGPLINGRVHELKIKEKFFDAVRLKQKTNEVRKSDREFVVGDYLALNEIDAEGNYTRRHCLVIITHILNDPDFCKEGHVILSFMPCRIE